MKNLQKDTLCINHNLDMLLKHQDTFSDNEAKYIIRNGLLYLLPNNSINLNLNCSRKELIGIAHKVKSMLT